MSKVRLFMLDLLLCPVFTGLVAAATFGNLKWAENFLCFAIWPFTAFVVFAYVSFNQIMSDAIIRDSVVATRKRGFPKWLVDIFLVSNVVIAAFEGWYVIASLLLVIWAFVNAIRTRIKELRRGLDVGV